MSGGMLYGGDEIGALVFDLGHHSLRVGYAQEDTPKAEIPAVVGIGEDGNCATTKAEPMDIDDKKPDNNVTQSGSKYYIDTTILHVPRKNMEVVSYMKDGMIEDWDHFEKVAQIYTEVQSKPLHSQVACTQNTDLIVSKGFRLYLFQSNSIGRRVPSSIVL